MSGADEAPTTLSLLALATGAATEAAAFLVDQRPRDLRASGTKSSPTDVVTAMDTAAERLIAAHVRAQRPDDAFLGEEGTSARTGAGSRVRWVVDPIDGTVNYLRDLPAWAVSVAAELDGTVVAGVVVNPRVGETFTAALGAGAWRNGVPVGVSGAEDLASALVATGFGYARARRAEQAEVVRRVLPLVGDVRRMGAASLDLCSVACGRVDAYYERGLSAWDHAAGGLVAREAGARVEGRAGAPPGEALVLAATPGVFDALHALVAGADG